MKGVFPPILPPIPTAIFIILKNADTRLPICVAKISASHSLRVA
jgi:hypothetical protein